ncbi:CPBP family intramembrane glutamic endopeptidase [Nocardia terrae]|uniref:CPBP family intramembrane glutamic endopeptidase n=1 Tax=Nocardia terrae TaxID=2675851 RepID=UPI0012FA317D|nr:CPBP family intramembrane glutamic endopeptidase [Nocardia terrae]
MTAFGLAWVLGVGPWLDGQGLRSHWLRTGAGLMMLTPTLGVLAVAGSRRISLSELVSQVGLRLGDKPARVLWSIIGAWLGMIALVWGAFGLAAAFGLFEFDFSYYNAGWMAALLVADLTTAILVNIPLTLGEEIGWRGWLMPQLVNRFGIFAGVITTGVIWALWHAPLTLLGYNYPELGAWAVVAFIGFCVTVGCILGWLRLWSGSVWPSAVAHAASNATMGSISVFAASGRQPHSLLSAGGVTGWVLFAIVAATLFAIFPVRTAGHRDRPAGGHALRDAAGVSRNYRL